MKNKIIVVLSVIIALFIFGSVVAGLAATVKKQKKEIAALEAAIEKTEAEKKALTKTAQEYKKINDGYKSQTPTTEDALSPEAIDDFNLLFDLWRMPNGTD